MNDSMDDPVAASGGRWAKVIDQSTCIGCHACTTACKSENDVPVGVTRTFVKSVDVGSYPNARRRFQVTRCNQCEDSPCTRACPTGAMYRREDGIVDFDKDICIGCRACMAACPYDAIFINPEDHSAEKCNFCSHRIDAGLEPACVVVCPTQSIFVGDLDDPDSRVARTVQEGGVAVRRPEKGTRPRLHYKGAHQATLDPLAAARPEGGLYAWAEQLAGGDVVPGGHPDRPTSSAAARISYDHPHRRPWGWSVSAYTWTKNLAAGLYLVPLMLVALGLLPASSPLWQWVAPVGGGAFLALTGLLLVGDLAHPGRFWLIFRRPRWESWLVRGGLILVGYGALLAAHWAAGLAGAPGVQRALMWPGALLAVLCSIYTAFLFAQARARDLWQSPLLAPHLLVQALAVGGALLAPLALYVAPSVLPLLLVLVAVMSALHLALLAVEPLTTPATASVDLAVRTMVRGRYAGFFWGGAAFSAVGCAAPWLGPWFCLFALFGPLAYEHAFVQSGQSVPLA